ncbi:hypothetical protein MVEN_02293600 [Mycena venus]|uniref:DUF6534 domain-containing protein n=1 Tax=Mycena venus TaxID=2733690 RepID=A0A8H7CG23_9AGAR|nr:hypothetical protein MVEN_02293600 [Mycena venus]
MAVDDGQTLPFPDPGFEHTYAPLFFGVVLNVLLFGVFIVQVHAYFRFYKTDYPYIRYLIYYLITMEIINTVCDIGLIYEPLIKLHNSPLVYQMAPTLLAADPVVTTLISTPTQLFMAWRIRQVTKSNWLAGIVALLAFTSLVGGVGATIGVATHREFARFRLVEPQLTIWLTSTAFADLFITALLVNFLWVHKTGFKTQTDSVTDKIIFCTVQTGMLTSFAAIADVTLFLIVPDSTLMFIWDFSLSKLYSICLLSTLNARTDWNNLLVAMPTDDEKKDPNAIIKVRRATDIQGLQLYIPSQFEFNSAGVSPARKRTPRTEWIPQPLPFAATRGHGHNKSFSSSDSESARRTAAWAMVTGR